MSEPTSPPQYWSRATSSKGDVLTYAIREGTGFMVLLAIAAVLIGGGVWAMYWLAAGGGLTIAGIIFMLLVPGSIILAGVYSLDAALWRRHEYLLGPSGLEARRVSLFGAKSLAIHRSSIVAINQAYSPPSASSGNKTPGDWVTFVTYRDGMSGKETDYALDGMTSAEEARWLAPLLCDWAKVPLKRGYGAAFDEADPKELPKL
jgi:hypothetical protein